VLGSLTRQVRKAWHLGVSLEEIKPYKYENSFHNKFNIQVFQWCGGHGCEDENMM